MTAPIYVGCQGWRYPDWRNTPENPGPLSAPFYTKDIPQPEEIPHYAKTFSIVEIDSTFYATPAAEIVQRWRDASPPEFRFTMKLPRILTHEFRLRRGGKSLTEFCNRAELMGERLSSILIQLPPNFTVEDEGVLARFLPHLPGHLPFAIEFRARSWLRESVMEILRKHNVSLCLGPTPWLGTAVSLPWVENLPGEFFYLRIIGERETNMPFTHLREDKDEELKTWAGVLKQLSEQGRPCLALADNHYQGFSPGTVTLIKRFLGQTERPFPRDQTERAGQFQFGL